jgi:hypothetical protein
MKFSFFKGAVLPSILLSCLAGLFLACSHDMPVTQQSQPQTNLQATLSSIKPIFLRQSVLSLPSGTNAPGNPSMSLASAFRVTTWLMSYQALIIIACYPGNVNNSVLYLKVSASAGNRMP